jgi:NAD(P)-dependent dehydrogenase (short-subunit alcohol dehydrogenase family)
MGLSGKRLIVVGGSSGMGLAIAKAALAEGAEVTIVGRSATKLNKAATDLGGNGRLNTFECDITCEADVVKLFAAMGSFHYLVNTAVDVTNSYSPIEKLDLANARKLIDSKLIGPLLLAKYGSQQIDRDGSITFTSGIAAYRPGAGASVVAIVNSALAGLARALAVELAPVRVNVVSPGWTDTPVWDVITDSRSEKEARLQQMAQRLPARRVGQPEDIAQAVLPLMQNGYITGTVLHVDGGQRLV